jgi:hypothetical protein
MEDLDIIIKLVDNVRDRMGLISASNSFLNHRRTFGLHDPAKKPPEPPDQSHDRDDDTLDMTTNLTLDR